MNEHIISVAIRDRVTGLIYSLPKPARHHDVLHTIAKITGRPIHDPDGQGFLTSTGRYVGRQEAAHIATEANQLLQGGLIAPPKLYSEDLW